MRNYPALIEKLLLVRQDICLLIMNKVIFKVKKYFDEDSTQNYLVFIPISRYFKLRSITNVIDYALSWQSKGLASEIIKAVSTSHASIGLL